MLTQTDKNPLSIHSRVNTEENGLIGSPDNRNNTTNNGFLSSMKKKERTSDNILRNRFNEYDFLKDIERDHEVQEIMKMFTFCHKSSRSGKTFESKLIEEKAMLTFARNFNFEFKLEGSHDLRLDSNGNMSTRTIQL